MPQPAHVEHGQTSTGIDQNLAAMLSYVLGFISGLIFYLAEKDNKYVRFHALQSVLLSVAELIVYFAVSSIGTALLFSPGLAGLAAIISIVLLLLSIGMLVLWIMLLVRAYQGVRWSLPIIGPIAERNA